LEVGRFPKIPKVGVSTNALADQLALELGNASQHR
jgi:hypothetical protein